ncbi:MAG: Caulobacter phage CcrColossus [Candidatus Parcubacteria bacterium]|jgi:NH3-dependent NAD+ synthetase
MRNGIEALVDAIRDDAADAVGLLVPVSGGSDSALAFWLCTQAFPEKTVAVHAGRALRGRPWFERTGRIEFTDVPGGDGEREEMRWARFLAMGLSRRAWLVGSRNRTEDALGTYSLASRVATFLPVVGVWKSDVQRLCAQVGVPAEIIASSLKADPECGRPAELAEIPFGLIETFLRVRSGALPHEALSALSAPQIAYLDGILRRNAFKSRLPIRGASF